MTDDQSKGERTRAAIITAAHDLFVERGYAAASMRQIAERAGIALGGIYNHFPGKEDIFREVVLAYHPYHDILPALAATPHGDIEDLLRHAARLIDETLSQRPDVFNLMFTEMVEFRSAHLPELLQRVFPLVAQILQRFTETGSRLRPIPLPMLMRTFLGTMLGYFITKNALGSGAPPEFHTGALDHFLNAYLHGIIQPETPA